MVRTPSGGAHLYYRHNGEQSRNLRASEGLAIEIKSDKTQVLVPPSVGASGKRYEWQGEFGLEGFDSLKPIKAGSAVASITHLTLAKPPKGERNEHLFRRALRLALRCNSEAELFRLLLDENAELEETLDEGEVARIAESAWGYEERGENWAAYSGFQKVAWEDVERFGGEADALLLWHHLQKQHSARERRGEFFSIAPKPMAAHRVITGWGEKRYRSARDQLRRLGFIECVHKGGQGPHDPALYRFCSKGAAREHNATEHAPRRERDKAG